MTEEFRALLNKSNIFIDSDDWLEPIMLEKMYYKAINENCDMVTAGYFVYVEQKCAEEKDVIPRNIRYK